MKNEHSFGCKTIEGEGKCDCEMGKDSKCLACELDEARGNVRLHTHNCKYVSSEIPSDWEYKQRFVAQLSQFVAFIEDEIKRSEEEKQGLRRKDGGRFIASSSFLKHFTAHILSSQKEDLVRKMLLRNYNITESDLTYRYEESIRKKCYNDGIQDCIDIVKNQKI